MSKNKPISLSGLLLAVAIVTAHPALGQETALNFQRLGEKLLNAVDANDMTLVRSILAAEGSEIAAEEVGLQAAGIAVEKGYYPIAHYILAVRTLKLNARKENPSSAAPNQQRLSQGRSVAPAPRAPVAVGLPPAGPQTSALAPPPPVQQALDLPKLAAPQHNPFEPGAAPRTSLPVVTQSPPTQVAARVAEPATLPKTISPEPLASPKPPPSAPPTQIKEVPTDPSEGKPGFFGNLVKGVTGVFDSKEQTEVAAPAPPVEEPSAEPPALEPPPPASPEKEPETLVKIETPPAPTESVPSPDSATPSDSADESGEEKPGFFGNLVKGVTGAFDSKEQTEVAATAPPVEEPSPEPPALEPPPLTTPEKEPETLVKIETPPAPAESVPSPDSATPSDSAEESGEEKPGFFGNLVKGVTGVFDSKEQTEVAVPAPPVEEPSAEPPALEPPPPASPEKEPETVAKAETPAPLSDGSNSPPDSATPSDSSNDTGQDKPGFFGKLVNDVTKVFDPKEQAESKEQAEVAATPPPVEEPRAEPPALEAPPNEPVAPEKTEAEESEISAEVAATKQPKQPEQPSEIEPEVKTLEPPLKEPVAGPPVIVVDQTRSGSGPPATESEADDEATVVQPEVAAIAPPPEISDPGPPVIVVDQTGSKSPTAGAATDSDGPNAGEPAGGSKPSLADRLFSPIKKILNADPEAGTKDGAAEQAPETQPEVEAAGPAQPANDEDSTPHKPPVSNTKLADRLFGPIIKILNTNPEVQNDPAAETTEQVAVDEQQEKTPPAQKEAEFVSLIQNVLETDNQDSTDKSSTANKIAEPPAPVEESRPPTPVADAGPPVIVKDQTTESPLPKSAERAANIETPVPAAPVEQATAPVKPDPPRLQQQASLPRDPNYPPPVNLAIGRSLLLGRELSENSITSKNCFRKGADKAWFCLETADWPGRIGEQFEVDAWLYRKARTVVRYEEGRSVRVFSVIPSKNYAKAVSHYVRQFGPPTEVVDGTIARFGDTPLNNPSTRWIRRLVGDRRDVLEIRRFDDLRGMVPDETVGVIRLYREGTRPIFTYLSDTDLMLHRMRTAKSPNIGKPK